MADNTTKSRYYQFYDENGKKFDVDANAFDSDMKGFSEAYPDVSMRMVDKNGEQWDIPVANVEKAMKEGGYRLWQWEQTHVTVPKKAQKQVSSQPAQPTQPQQKPSGPYKPTDMEMMGYGSFLGNAQYTAENATKGIDQLEQASTQASPFGSGNVGIGNNQRLRKGKQTFDAEKGTFVDTYLTSDGREFRDIQQANDAQTELDAISDDVRYAEAMKALGMGDISTEKDKPIEQRLKEAYAERMELQRMLSEENKKGELSVAMRADPMMGITAEESHKKNTNRFNLESALRLLERRITALEAERDDKGQSMFWRGTADTLKDSSTYSLGLSDLADADVMSQLKAKLDSVDGKVTQLSDSEKVLVRNFLLNQEAQRLNEKRGNMYGFGQMFGQSLPFMAEFYLTGGFSALGQAGTRFGTKAGLKMAASELGKQMTKNVGGRILLKTGQSLLKGTGRIGGALAGGALQSNTIGAAKTISDITDRNLGNLTLNDNGNLDFKDGEGIAESFLKGQLTNAFENGSELLGPAFDFAPNYLARVIKNKIAGGAVNKLLSNKAWRGTNKILRKFGVQGLFGEGMEEEANNIGNVLIGESNWFKDPNDPNKPAFFDGEEQFKTWAGVAMTGAVLRGPALAVNGYQKAQYYANRYNLNSSDRQMRSVLGDYDRYENIKAMLDGATNESIGSVLNNIMQGGQLDYDEKKAVVMYAQDLVNLRGFNIGSVVAAAVGAQPKPRVASYNVNGNTVEELDADGNVLATHEYEDIDAMKAGLYELQQQRFDDNLASDISVMKTRPTEQYEQLVFDYLSQNNPEMTPSEFEAILAKPSLERTEEEQQLVAPFADILHDTVYDNTILHEEQSVQDGEDIADADAIDIEEPNDDGMKINAQWMEAQDNRRMLFDQDENLKQEVEMMESQGLSHQEIISRLDWAKPEQVQGMIDYYNTKAKYEGYVNRMAQKIDEEAANSRQRHTMKGTIDGVADLNNVHTITDGTNRYYLVSGDVTTDPATGRITGSTSGLIIGMDLDGSFVNLNESDGYSLDPVVQTLDQFEEEERIRLQEQMTQVIDPNQTMNQQLNQPQPTGEQAGAQAGASTGTGANEAPAAPLSSEPQQPQVTIESVTDKDGVKRYEQGIPVDDAIADIQNDGFDVNEVADASIAEAQQAIDKINKKPTKTRKDLMDQKSQQSVIDYYNNVKARWEEMNQPAEPQPTEQPAVKQPITPSASGLTVEEQKQERIAALKAELGDLFDDDFTVANDVYELVSMWVGRKRNLAWDDVNGKRGLQKELGWTRKIGGDTKYIETLLAKKGEGMGVDEFVHMVWESPENDVNGEKRWDDTEIKEALLELLKSAESKSDVVDYALNSRETQARAALEEQRKMEEDAAQQPADTEPVEIPDGGLPFAPSTDEDFTNDVNETQEIQDNNVSLQQANEELQSVMDEVAHEIQVTPYQFINNESDLQELKDEGVGEEFIDSLRKDLADESTVGRFIPEMGIIVYFPEKMNRLGMTPIEKKSSIYHENVHALSRFGYTKEDFANTAHQIGWEYPELGVAIREEHQEQSEEVQNEEIVSYFIQGIIENGEVDSLMNGTFEDASEEITNLVNEIFNILRNGQSRENVRREAQDEGNSGTRQETDELVQESEIPSEVTENKQPTGEGVDTYLLPRNAEEEQIIADVDKQLQGEIFAQQINVGQAKDRYDKKRQQESDRATDMFSDDETRREEGQLFGFDEMPTDRTNEGVNQRAKAEKEAWDAAKAKLEQLQSPQERNSRIRGALDNFRRQTSFTDTEKEIDERHKQEYEKYYKPLLNLSDEELQQMAKKKEDAVNGDLNQLQFDKEYSAIHGVLVQREMDRRRDYVKSFIDSTIDDNDITFVDKLTNTEFDKLYSLIDEYGVNDSEGKIEDYVNRLRKKYPVRGKGSQKNETPLQKQDKWQYEFHYNKETGRAWITRDDVSGPVPLQDGTFYIEGKNLAELRGILENPASNLGEILKAVDAPLHNAEVGEQIRNSETPTEAIETAAQAFRKEQQDTINKRKERWQGKKEPAYGADNKLVTTERYEELKKRMKEKMRGQLNSGIDPELISIGAEMAMYHIEAGAKKFADYATRMIADIGDVIRPYLQGFYEAARRMPGMEELRKEMDPTEYVDNFDVLNYDKQSDNTVNEHKEENNETEKVVSLQQEASDEVGRKPEDADKYRAFSQAVAEDMLKAMETGEQPYKNIKSIRAKAKSVGLDVDDEGRTDILLQELVEDGLVSAARQYVNTYMVQQMLAGKKAEDARTSRDLFNDIVKLYYLQPTISQRSSNRIKMQQYSTPLPMSFVADVFATPNKNDGTVLEPTAGNGMMVFAVPEYMVHANELDQTRLDNLRAQKFQKVTDQDATLPFEGDELYDAIIANPPFGAAPAKDYDGKEIRGLAEQIALNALSKMKDDGKAAIIIGGNMEYDKNGAIKSDKAFFTYLYDHYNVKGVIDMDGKLYSRQGTTYPTRLILIDGRRSEEERAQSKVYPPTLEKSAGNKVNTFEELYDLAEEIRNNNNKTDGTEILRTPTGIALPVNNDASGNTNGSERGRQPRQNDTDGGRNERGGSNKGNQKSTEKGTQKRGGSRTVGVQQPRTPGLFDAEENPSQPQPQTGGNRQGGSTVNHGESRPADVQGERTVDNGVGLTQPKETPTSAVIQQAPQQTKPKVEEKRELDTDKLSYRPHNTAFSLESVAPAAMVEAMDNMLSKIEKEHGNIDEWVTKELGYDSVEDMHNALAAEQVDSVAMAIYQMKHGQGMIIGDQTGVGKGRQMAALIRWACKQGKKPVFITQKADLFSDIYRDLVDIGSGELRPFIFNSDGAMVDNNGVAVHKPLSATSQAKVFAGDKLPDGYDFAVLTYSQVNTGDQISQDEAKTAAKDRGERYQKKKKEGKPKATPKATFLRALAKDNYMFLDESHTAAGKSNTGYYFQSILKTAKAVTFASATFAKRPDTMPMYALRTAMSKAKVKAEKLIEIIENGGVALQEIMSRALTQAGQMVRRERDMSDVVTDWKTVDDPATVKKARENYDRTIEAFNAIIDFQKNWVSGYLDNLSKDLAEVAASAGMRQGTEDLGIKNVPFASKTYNYTKQLMLALKVDAIVDEVVKEIEAGRHPVIALENTMGSMLDDYAPGDTLEETTFAASLLKGLKGVLRYTITDEDGNQQQLELKPEQLGTEGAASYHEVEELIRKSTSGIFISPLDAITEKLKQKGYKVGELTGRQQYVELDENTGEYTVRRRTDRDKKKMQREFNNGSLDVLILNKSASTGISLHASEKFSDKRQRTMIIAQPLADINDYMQMIGRIDRTGQVHRGYYINLGLPVPAEGRFLMMLSTKLKSLNANTTTSQENESNDVEAPDLLNKYGSKVVVEYLRDNPDVYVKMGEPLKKDKSKLSVSELDTYDAQEDDARKITGYVALLPTDEQDAFYNDVVRRYNELIKYLNDTGSNDLKISVLPLRARTIDKQVSSEGADPNGSNPFAGNAYVEWVEMDVLKKPMKASEIEKTIEQLNPEVENAPSAQAKTAAQEKMLNGKLTPRVRQILDTVERETQAKLDKENERYEAAKKRAEEDIDAKAETINKQQKRTEEQKKEAIDKYASDRRQSVEESHNNMVNKIDASHDRMVKFLEMFRVGDSVLVPDDLTTDAFMGSSPAIFCGFKAKDEGVTPSTTLAVFATLDGRRKIEIKLSDWGALVRIDNMTQQNWDAAHEVTLSNWDSQIPSETRKHGFIMTGNILQAFADAGDNGRVPGQLVTYTDIDGNVHDGILMNQHWEPSQLKGSTVPLRSRMEEIKNMPYGDSITSADGNVVIDRSFRYYTISVPKSKKVGGQYYENDALLGLVSGNNFYPSRGSLRGDVAVEDIEKVVEVLSDLGVQVQSDTQVRFDTETEMGQAQASGRRFDEDIEETSKKHSKQTEHKNRIAKHIDNLVKKLGTKSRTTVYHSFDELPADMKEYIREREKQGKKVRGWYENGHIYLYLPHIDSIYQAEKTIWHETVAHHGLRQLIGEENLNKLLKQLWLTHKDGAMGEWVSERMQQNGWALNEAIEEYLAREAEKNPFKEPGLWQRLRWMLADILHKMGFSTDPTISDIQYLFWVSQNQLNDNDPMAKIRQQAFLFNLDREAANTPYVNMNATSVEDIDNPDAEGAYDDGIRHSEETDEEVIERLEKEPKVKAYRAMQLIDGKLYPPMAAKQGGKLVKPIELGKWEKADEHPEMADNNGKFKLDKGNGKSLKAAYNPYIHTSTTMLNDQFSEAQNRPNLVVVEVEVPESELTSGYKAEKAKDKVGKLEWKAGVIQGQLSGTREVILSRWDKPVRIVPTEEVAQHIADMIKGKVDVMPTNVVTPQQRAELEKLGVKFVETDNRGFIKEGENAGKSYSSVYGKKSGRRFDEDIDDPMTYSAKQVYNERMNTVETVFTEAYQDSMIALKTAQNAIAGDKDIPDSQNAYMAENLMHGKNKNEQDLFNRMFRDPLIATINKILNLTGMNWGDVDRYVYTKSGLERNRELYVRDWLVSERGKKIYKYEDLNTEEQDIYDGMAATIEDMFEDGDIDEAEKSKKLTQALQKAHQRYIDDLETQWIRLKNDRYTELRNGDITYPDYLNALSDFILDNIDGSYKPEENDYSGFRAMYGDEDGKYNEVDIISELMDTEDAINGEDDVKTTDTLWEQINAATQYALERYREAGMRSDEDIDRVEQMFHFYVPMRGFKAETGEDMYQYFTGKDRAKSYVGGLLKHAKGRGSEADFPISTIFAMSYKAIADCNQNLVNQKFYRLCQANPNDLVVLSDSWAVYDEIEGVWKESSPEIPEDAAEDEVRQITLDWEDRMRKLALEHKAKKIKGKAEFDYKPIDKKNQSEHIIDVRINGQPKKMIVTSNPRMAQALNGQLRFEHGRNIFRIWNAAIKNFMASVFTSYSPTFALRNMARDWTHFRTMLGVREGSGYAKQANKYYRQSLFKMVGLFKKYRDGKLDESNEMERDFKDFMDNGGVTGFVFMQKIDDIQKEMENIYKKQKEGKTIRINDNLWEKILGAVEALNEGIENNARFATYRASRHYAGRTKARSAYDAKEITVNFNRKGAGGKTAGYKSQSKAVQDAAKVFGVTGQILGEGKVFFNATVQAIATTFKNFQNADGSLNKKYIAKWAALYALPPFMFGVALPLINKALAAVLGGDDDDPYANLPEWTRRKNICIYIGNGNFITIPIGQELAAFLTLGDIFAGNTYAPDLKPIDRSWDDEILGVMNTFSPVDIDTKTTKGGLMEDPISEVTSRTFSVLAPLVAVEQNLGWTGRPIYKEDRFPNDKYKPEYQQVYQSTNPVLVGASKMLHEIGGGNDRARGKEWSEVNPAIIQYLWEQYTGGPGKVFSNTISIGKDAKDLFIEGEMPDFNIRKVEGLKAFVQQGDDRTQHYRTQAKFFKYQEDANKFKYDHDITKLRKQAKNDPVAKMELEKLEKTEEYQRFEIIEKANRSSKEEGKVGLDEFRKEIQNTTDRKEKRQKQQTYNKLMKGYVDLLDAVGSE